MKILTDNKGEQIFSCASIDTVFDENGNTLRAILQSTTPYDSNVYKYENWLLGTTTVTKNDNVTTTVFPDGTKSVCTMVNDKKCEEVLYIKDTPVKKKTTTMDENGNITINVEKYSE